jgi:hypothetical protein
MTNNPALTGGPALWVGHHLSDSSDKVYAVWIEHHPPTAYRVMTGFGPRTSSPRSVTLGPRGIYEMLAGAEGEMTKIVAEKSHDYVSIDAEAYKQVGMVTFGGGAQASCRSASRIYQYPGQKVVDMLTAPAEPRIKDGLNRLLVESPRGTPAARPEGRCPVRQPDARGIQAQRSGDGGPRLCGVHRGVV